MNGAIRAAAARICEIASGPSRMFMGALTYHCSRWPRIPTRAPACGWPAAALTNRPRIVSLAYWRNTTMKARIAGVLASDKRILILEWLKEPTRHFPPQRDGDLEKDGVCGILIAEKLGVSHPTASEHLR